MTPKCTIFLVVLSFASLSLYSQSYKSKWQTKPSFGVYFPSTKLLKGVVTDNLLEYDDESFYWQVLSASYFFHKHWGIEFNFQAGSSGRISKRDDRFIRSIESTYGDQYFVTASTAASYDNFSIIGGDIERGYLGVIYRLESKRFLLYPKFAIGVTSFRTNWGNAYLKEKESNNVLRVSFDPGKVPNDHFTIAPSLGLGYKLTKRVFFNVDLLTSYYKTNITFVKTVTDLNTGQESKEEIGYKKGMFNTALGAGLIIVL